MTCSKYLKSREESARTTKQRTTQVAALPSQPCPLSQEKDLNFLLSWDTKQWVSLIGENKIVDHQSHSGKLGDFFAFVPFMQLSWFNHLCKNNYESPLSFDITLKWCLDREVEVRQWRPNGAVNWEHPWFCFCSWASTQRMQCHFLLSSGQGVLMGHEVCIRENSCYVLLRLVYKSLAAVCGGLCSYLSGHLLAGVLIHSCNFDHGLCGWIREKDSDLHWEPIRDPAGNGTSSSTFWHCLILLTIKQNEAKAQSIPVFQLL